MSGGKSDSAKRVYRRAKSGESTKIGDNKLDHKFERHIAQVIARLLNDKTPYVRGDWER